MDDGDQKLDWARGLVHDCLGACHVKYQKGVNEHMEMMQWLQEFLEETSKKMTQASTVLEQMPKTPSVTRKAQRRVKARESLERVKEDQENLTPVLPKIKTKLTFDADVEEEKEPEPAPLGRGLRKCASRTKLLAAEVQPKPYRATRNSRKPVKKAAVDRVDQAKASTTEVSSGVDDQSPSVRSRATAYEAMIRARNSVSPIKSNKAGTPKIQEKAAQKPQRAQRKSSVRKSSHSIKKQKTSEPRANRTRLRLKKNQKKEPEMTTDSEGTQEDQPGLVGSLNETEVVVNEVFELTEGRTVELKQQEVTKIKTTPLKDSVKLVPSPVVSRLSSDQGFNDGDDEQEDTEEERAEPANCSVNQSKSMAHLKEMESLKPSNNESLLTDSDGKLNQTFSKKSPPIKSTRTRQKHSVMTESEEEPLRSTRTRQKPMEVIAPEIEPTKSTRTRQKPQEMSHSESEEPARSTRTRQKAMEVSASESEEPAKSTRTRQKPMETTQNESDEPTRSTRTRQKHTALSDESDLNEPAKSTRTRQQPMDTSESALGKAHTTEAVSNVVEPEEPLRSTRTRQKAVHSPPAAEVEEASKPTRTRQKKADANSTFSVQDPKHNEEEVLLIETPPARTTRTRQRAKQEDQRADEASKQVKGHVAALLPSDDEVVASSPIPGTPKAKAAQGKKRLMEERGASPRPKRSRSCLGDSIVQKEPPLLASSPVKRGAEENDVLMSPIRVKKTPPRAYQFNSAQKKVSSFLNRTPGFAQSTNRMYSFLNNSANLSASRPGVVTSFLKRHTPPPKYTIQEMQEQKKRKLQEKENKERERLKKAADLRKKKVEEQRKQREEKARRVAEAKEQRLQRAEEQRQRLNQKMEQHEMLHEKMQGERLKEEREKQKLRMKKQMEADARRRQEEEDRRRKFLEMEQEAKQQEEYLQRKRDHEEAERKRQIQEEKRRNEERLQELEQKRKEEMAKQKRLEEEKQQEREKIRQERERQLAVERAEREQLEKQRKEMKDKKIAEEMAKLKALEQERMEKLAKEAESVKKAQEDLNKMIKKHNKNVTQTITTTVAEPPAPQTKSQTSYEITPKKMPVASNNPNDYGLDDKDSDDSTDDDDAPKKKIPEWAMGKNIQIAVIRQVTNPPDLRKIFRYHRLEDPSLEVVFTGAKRKRYNIRTSSAIWHSPPMTKH